MNPLQRLPYFKLKASHLTLRYSYFTLKNAFKVFKRNNRIFSRLFGVIFIGEIVIFILLMHLFPNYSSIMFILPFFVIDYLAIISLFICYQIKVYFSNKIFNFNNFFRCFNKNERKACRIKIL